MRQTLSYIKNLLATYGIDPKNKLGQNFLIDLNTLDFVISAGELSKEDAVLEIGPGTGTLTHNLVERAGFVLSAEIDSRFEPILGSLFLPNAPFELHMGDILASKNKLDPVVLDKWRAGAALYGCTRFKLVANLPYSVATPVLINLILSEIPIERLVGMVQFETAEKISADVGSEAYSGLAVLAQSLSDCRIIRRVPPTVFHPRPKVDSAILEMIPNSQKRSVLCNALSTSNDPNIGPYRFRVFLRDLFLHRRKALRAALVKMPLGAQIPKEMLDQLITRLELPMQIRADQMTHTQLIELSKGWWEIKNQFDPQELSIQEDLIIDS